MAKIEIIGKYKLHKENVRNFSNEQQLKINFTIREISRSYLFIHAQRFSTKESFVQKRTNKAT
jgi:uncharacterized protein YktA (UPF0223 family)